jgi:hypothetical protein
MSHKERNESVNELQEQLAIEREAHEGASIMAADACKAEQVAMRKLRERDQGCLQLNDTIRHLQATLAVERASKVVLLRVLQAAYLKHHVGIDDVGWNKLSDMMCDALCEAMGDRDFQEWLLPYGLLKELDLDK